MFGSDGKTYVRRKVNTRYEMKHLKPTVKHGGGTVMVWGCFSYAGVGKITIIDGKMDSIQYTRIINSCLKASAVKLGLYQYTFQQDNDPKHTSKHTKDYFNDKKIKLMSWPSQSPDMNPIEHLWTELKKEVKKKCPKNINELKAIITDSWEQINPEICRTLVLSMPNRSIELY